MEGEMKPARAGFPEQESVHADLEPAHPFYSRAQLLLDVVDTGNVFHCFLPAFPKRHYEQQLKAGRPERSGDREVEKRRKKSQTREGNL